MKNLDTSSIKNIFNDAKNWIVRYRIVLFVVSVAVALGFMILRISQMSTLEPSVQQKSEALLSIKLVTIDEDAIAVIEQLEDKNIAIETLFDPGRYDPFSD